MEKLTFNYFYFGVAIIRSEFLNNVPDNWMDDLDEFDEYHWGGYKAVPRN